jgi:hypothetical protein
MKTLKPALLGTALLLAGGCVDDKPVVELFGICAMPGADDCTFGGECDAFYIGDIVTDLAAANRLWLVIEVHNQLLPNDDPDIGRVNTHDAFVQEVRVEFDGLPLDETSHRLQNVVPAAGSTVISVFPLTEETVAQLVGVVGSVNIVAKVRLRGVFGDASEFETEPFEIPVRVCTGCLGVPGGCATAGDFVVSCPPVNQGSQLPVTYACVSPP